MKIKILLVDDHRLFRVTLKTMLNMQPDMEVIGEAENGMDAVVMASQLIPDVILMDVKMPRMDGAEATRRILAEVLDTKVLALSMYADDGFMADMKRAGVSGYVLKGGDFVEMCDTIRRTAHHLS